MKKLVAVKTRAVIYARVSSNEQEAEGFSVDAQLRLLRAYAAEKGLDVAIEFMEAETAKKAGRSSFTKMLKFLQDHPGHIILVEKVDRLYRNFADYVKVDHLGVELHFVKDGMVISESSKSQDKFMHGIRVLMAKNYVDNLSEEIRKGLNEKAAQGIYPTHAPLGYLNSLEPGTKRKMIVPDPARAHLIKAMFEKYATGIESYETVTQFANKAGLTSKKGKSLPRSAVEQILRHPAYCGIIRWNGKDSVGIHEPLISREVWNRVQAIREGRATNKGFGGKDFAYRGLIRCNCKEIMSGELKKGKYVYYHCSGRKREICGRPYIAESRIDAAFEEMFKRLQIPPDELEWIRFGLSEADKDRHGRREVREREIRTEIAAHKRNQEQLYLDKLASQIGLEFYKETMAKWESKVTELQLEIAAIDRTETSTVDETMRLFELASKAYIRFKNADSDQKRELVNFVCSNSIWEDGKLTIDLEKEFDLMLNCIILPLASEDQSDEKRLVLMNSVNWWR